MSDRLCERGILRVRRELLGDSEREMLRERGRK